MCHEGVQRGILGTGAVEQGTLTSDRALGVSTALRCGELTGGTTACGEASCLCHDTVSVTVYREGGILQELEHMLVPIGNGLMSK